MVVVLLGLDLQLEREAVGVSSGPGAVESPSLFNVATSTSRTRLADDIHDSNTGRIDAEEGGNVSGQVAIVVEVVLGQLSGDGQLENKSLNGLDGVGVATGEDDVDQLIVALLVVGPELWESI